VTPPALLQLCDGTREGAMRNSIRYRRPAELAQRALVFSAEAR
jgi:hypothetical protein